MNHKPDEHQEDSENGLRIREEEIARGEINKLFTWRCKCNLTLPNWGAKTTDGYLRCSGCKRVWTLKGKLVIE